MKNYFKYLVSVLQHSINIDEGNTFYNLALLFNNYEDNYKKITDVIGGANKVYAYVSEKEKVANIRIHYDRKGINQGFELSGLPSFYSDESFKLSCVNEILKENGIGIREDLWDGGERGSDSYIVTFDASMLLEQRDKLLKENNTGIKSR